MLDRTFLSVGEDGLIGISDWLTVSQSRIDLFAQATDDFQFIHVDPERAAAEAPFGGTIAHGFLTLSLISTLATEVIPQKAHLRSIIIAGIDKVKFMTPLPAGGRVRGVFKLDRHHLLSDTRILVKVFTTIEGDALKRPVLTCDVSWIMEVGAAAMEADTGQKSILESASAVRDTVVAPLST